MAERLAEQLVRAMEALDDLPECSGRHAVLVFGSHARRQSGPSSDVDLLVIGSVIDRTYCERPGLSLDLICETRDSVREKLKKPDRQNNHFLLNILSEAVVLWDPDGIGAALKRRALRLRDRGPKPLPATEARLAERAIVLMLRSAKAEPARLQGYTIEQRRLCRMRLDQVVSRAIYLCCKARCRWTSSFPLTVVGLKEQEPALHKLWVRYAGLPLDEVLPAATAIVDFTVQCLQEST